MQLYSSRSPQHVLVGAITFLCLILLLSACTPGTQAAQSQQQPSLFSKMDAFLTTKAKVLDFNGSVLVARNGHILLSKGYGMANADQALANTPTTM